MAHSTQHTANYVESSLPQIKISPKPSKGNRHSHRRHHKEHQGASHSAVEEHVWDGGTRCGPRSNYRLLTRQAMGTSYIADYSPK